MAYRYSKVSIVYALGCALLGWVALLIQLCILLNGSLSVPDALVKYFSFFTILTNIWVAISLTTIVIKGHADSFITATPAITATAAYILVVGLVYNIALRKIWDPQGWQLIADRILHDAMPALTILYWLLFIPKNGLKWRHPFFWLIYPAIYLVYTLILSGFTHQYPYPFVNLNTLTITEFVQNVLVLLLVFLVLGFLFVAVGRFIIVLQPNRKIEQ